MNYPEKPDSSKIMYLQTNQILTSFMDDNTVQPCLYHWVNFLILDSIAPLFLLKICISSETVFPFA